MQFVGIKRGDIIPPCTMCGSARDVCFAFTVVNRISPDEREIIPLWHCSRCDQLFDGFTTALANNQELMKYCRMPIGGSSPQMPFDERLRDFVNEQTAGVMEQLRREQEADWKRRENETLDKPDAAIQKIRGRVSGFKLK